MSPLPAGSVIGILGGGQLGRMLAGAAAQLGFDVNIFCPGDSPPAARVAAGHWDAEYDDETALSDFAENCDVITYEFENIPVASVANLVSKGVIVRPGVKSLEVSQDRLAEKQFLNAIGIETGAFEPVDSVEQLETALETLGGEGLLKTRRDGYDGKGQVRAKPGDDLEAAYKEIGQAPAILEALVPFEREISVVIARASDGSMTAFEPSKNDHGNGILKRSTVPCGLPNDVVARARKLAETLATETGHIGVLALELFVLEDGTLLANEMAPRVHNSGHWTPEACAIGQFEQHIRAVADWPLAPVTRHFDAEMENLLGEEALAPPESYPDGTVLTLYGKRDPKPGRKMGHIVRRTGRV
ncbi:5-(carboxyamino)imidazole ribonucleotide synthase [Henriciella barbarensis]|uniref:N5-carboxyaminoimidazole ribonucleotide synthase n=1 Tax=Henriciella barbarensis TaxID=86342 RepID=A0A399QZM2_9PROT|nr:5-(carboxyamino)imidazole ribonucleotide synthase [Henriciella barbarensis]RIJ24338.1 5-(carboxyamino)imidazole ribonucleotide synthase [Henriciella barbarensis]